MVKIESQLKEFAQAGLALFWQRQATFAGATLLAAFYVSIPIALICYSICQFSEFFDYIIAKNVLKWDGAGRAKVARYLKLLTLSSVISSGALVQYIIVVALAEGPSIHIGPLFFLFSAALYAAMNNCQVPRVLITRMTIYTAVFIFIPVYDIWLVRPPLDSELWKQLGVVLFVLYFVIECTRSFLRNYETGRAQLEELAIERDRVAKAYEIQSQFVSVVSHELRTPLTSIKGSIDLMNSGKIGNLPDGMTGVARIAQKNSNRLAFLIDDLLDFQKLKAGKMVFCFQTIDLEQLVREAVSINRAYGADRNISVKIVQPRAPVFVKGDEDRLMQVLANVLSNAIKFSHRDGVVTVSVENTAPTGRIKIRDEGIGIPVHSKDIVFGAFSQVDSSDSRGHGGTGLGMAITKQILEGHNGSIDYFSEEGEGTSFIIDLELAVTNEAEQKATKAA
jgi:signal transduction histidine kinase